MAYGKAPYGVVPYGVDEESDPGEAVVVTGSGSVSTSGFGEHFGTASASGKGSAAVEGKKLAEGSASVSGSGSCAVFGTAHGGPVSVSGKGSATAVGKKTGLSVITVSGKGAASVAGAVSTPIENEVELPSPFVIENEVVLDSSGTTFIENEVELPSDIRTVIEQEVELPSPILDTQTIESECVLPSPILSGGTTVVEVAPYATIRGYVIPLESATLTSDEGQYAWTCQLTLTNPGHYNLFRPEDDFTVTLPDDDPYSFIVQSVDVNRSGQVDLAASIAGIGPAALYASPRANPVSMVWDEAMLATEIVEELFGVGVVQWDIIDWSIPAHRLAAQDQTPMDILQRLASAAGATVQSDPDGTIRVRYLYPVSVPEYEDATPDHEYHDGQHNFSATSRTAPSKLANKIRILDVEPGAARDTIEFEQDPANYTRGTLRAFPQPWRTEVTLEHTSDSRVSASLVGESTEELTETVEVIAGKGSVSKPIHEIVELEWLYADLSGVAFEADSTEFTTTNETLTESLLRITYTTRFIEFEASAFADAEVQFLVREE